MLAIAEADALWDIACLLETDTFATQDIELPTELFALRHWPGPGSRAFAFVVAERNKRLVRRHVWVGEAGVSVSSHPVGR